MQPYIQAYKPHPLLQGNAYGYWKNKAKMSLYYSTFGAMMPELTYTSSTAYRFGFNGQEREDEIFKGAYTAEYWEYDARLGRRWNMDPIVEAGISRYSVYYNNPIYYVDPFGLAPSGPGDPPKEGDTKPMLDDNGNQVGVLVFDGKEWLPGNNGGILPEFRTNAQNPNQERRLTFWQKIVGAGNRTMSAVHNAAVGTKRKIQEVGVLAGQFAKGFLNSAGSNLVMGAGRMDPSTLKGSEQEQKAVFWGQVAGDVFSIYLGGSEAEAGGTSMVISGGATAPVSIPLTVHGTMTLSSAIIQIVQAGEVYDRVDEINDQGHNNTNKTNVNDDAPDNTEGINDRDWKKDKILSKGDIDQLKKTGNHPHEKVKIMLQNMICIRIKRVIYILSEKVVMSLVNFLALI